jgi:uridine kinase
MATTQIIYQGNPIEVEWGTPITQLFESKRITCGERPLGALAYGRLVGLDCPLRSPTTVELVTPTSREGVAIYRRTASLILMAAIKDLYPKARVVVGQSLARGYFFDVVDIDETDEFLEAVEQRMMAYIRDREQIIKERVPTEEARAFFEMEGLLDKVALLQARRSSHVNLVRLGNFRDIQHGPVALDASSVSDFELLRYPPGLVLRFDRTRRPEESREALAEPKLFKTYRETREWNEILGIPNVGHLNDLVIGGDVTDLIAVSEGFHEKKVGDIATMISDRVKNSNVRLVLIAGPSSSGKTTFSKRLALQLRVAGIRPVTLSMDNWYVNRVETPLDPETGDYDFECIEALDLELFNDNLARLLEGELVQTPVFDFKKGLRRPKETWTPMKLESDEILIVEGIHGLNCRLTESVAADRKYKIYVSALTQLCLDDHNRIFTSDTRLIRRIVRDARYRGYTAETSIMRWPSVRKGERKWIFPFQEQADVMFNSALVYEVSVLKVFAERFLLAVPPSSPAHPESYRLLRFLEHFVPIFRDGVPQISILREFIGGSAFVY